MLKGLFLLAITVVSSFALNNCLRIKKDTIRNCLIGIIAIVEVACTYFSYSSLAKQIIALLVVLLISVVLCFVLFFKQRKYEVPVWLDELMSMYISFFVATSITIFI